MEADMKIIGLAFLLAAGAACAQEAFIRELTGTVEVKVPGAAAWNPARQGQELQRNTLVSTGFKSSAVIALGNSTLTVQPLTRLSLEELIRTGTTEKVDLNLRVGRIRAEVKPPVGGATEFTVRSPSATASVRGTIFEFDGIRLSVDEGRVHVSGSGGGGAYVGAGGQALTNVETGRITGAAETARDTLAPSLPAGITGVPDSVSDSVPETGADVPSSGDIEVGIDWD
jgi:hypothetical protein